MASAQPALLVVDVQNIYTSADSELFCPASDKTVANINRLVRAFARGSLPVILIRHVHKADGSDLGRMFDYAGAAEDFNFKAGTPEVEYSVSLERPQRAIEIVKNRYSAFQGTRLDEILRKRGVNRVFVCGFMTNFCCESTAREAHDRDYYVTFVTDATGCPDLPKLPQAKTREMVSAFLEAGFATIASTSDALKAIEDA